MSIHPARDSSACDVMVADAWTSPCARASPMRRGPPGSGDDECLTNFVVSLRVIPLWVDTPVYVFT